jgi:3-oxoacyl-[acyl-carrier protein] reductase
MTARELVGQKIVVTGAASGLGQASALTLIEGGATLALIDRAGVDKIRAAVPGEGLHAFSADVSDEASIGGAIEAAAAALGGIDTLVHCAGIFEGAPLEETSLESFERVIRVNLTGTFLIVRAVAKLMKQRAKGGRIITFSSELAPLGREGHAAYCASKSGVSAMTRCWARELGPDILVNSVAPGPIDTPMLDWPNMDECWKKIEAGNLLGRIGQPREIAATVRFLAGPGASFITGQTIGVNGGAALS